MLADVFQNPRNKSTEMYELYSAYFLSAPGLPWKAWLKKTEIKLELLTDIDILLMVEKRIQGGYVMQYIGKLKQIMRGRIIWICKLFIKNHDRNSDKGYTLEVDVEYPKKLFSFYKDFLFLAEIKKKMKKRKQKNVNNLFVAYMTKKLCCAHNTFKTSIKSRINTKKVHKVIQFN